MIYNNIIDMIGDTPILKVNSFIGEHDSSLFIKIEKFNAIGLFD